MKVYLNHFMTIFFMLICQSIVLADHITVQGEVSGEWSTDTVLVAGDLLVLNGQGLVIQPGTVVQFLGNYAFAVQGSVNAAGNRSHNICFRVADTAEFGNDSIPAGGWGGIRFDHTRNTNATSVFDYCQFRNGKMVSDDPLTGHGGAIYVNAYDKVSISNCIFQQNFATFNGGAVYLDSADVSITYSTFSQNRCGPAVAPWGYGGAICSDNSSPEIRWNVFEDNSSTGVGGGLAVRFKDCNVYNNIFTGNISGLGGGLGILHMPAINYRINNNLVASNEAVYFGGGVASLDASPIYINNTIVYNQAMYGGGFYCKDSVSPGFYNTIFWGNNAAVGPTGYLFEIYSQADFYYCDVQYGPENFGGSGGGIAFAGAFEHCLDTVPLLLGYGEYPYSLDMGSPMIDAGATDTSGFFLPGMDLAEGPRVYNDIIDIGAYEWIWVGMDEKADNSDPVKIWPNPTTGEFKVQSAKFKVDSEIVEIERVEIVDMFGRIIETRNPEPGLPAGGWNPDFDISAFPAGIYIVRIFSKGQVYSVKMIHSFSQISQI